MTNVNSMGKFVVSRYNDLKDTIKQAGTERDGVHTVREHQLSEDRVIMRARVDDNPFTKDEIHVLGHGKGLMFDNAKEIRESFTEQMIKGRLCLTFNLVETFVMSGFHTSASLNETFDVNTFEKVKP